MSQEILCQIEGDFSVLDEEGLSVDTEIAQKIGNVFFESSGDNIKLQKIMKKYKHPANLLNLTPLKIYPQIESSQQYQISTSFVMSNEKTLYSSQNYVIKAISILPNMTNSISKASDVDIGGSLPEHYNTLESHFSRVYKKKETQPKKHSSFSLSCSLWTKTRYHISQS